MMMAVLVAVDVLLGSAGCTRGGGCTRSGGCISGCGRTHGDWCIGFKWWWAYKWCWVQCSLGVLLEVDVRVAMRILGLGVSDKLVL